MGLRKSRLSDEIRDLIGTSLIGGRMEDPRLQFVSITDVSLSADLQIAYVYFRTLQRETKDEAKRGLERASGVFRSILSEALDIRRVPSLKFFYDETIETAARVDKLLQDIENEKK